MNKSKNQFMCTKLLIICVKLLYDEQFYKINQIEIYYVNLPHIAVNCIIFIIILQYDA